MPFSTTCSIYLYRYWNEPNHRDLKKILNPLAIEYDNNMNIERLNNLSELQLNSLLEAFAAGYKTIDAEEIAENRNYDDICLELVVEIESIQEVIDKKLNKSK